jgi:hypothetical protein
MSLLKCLLGKDLSQTAGWAGVTELLSPRSYFSRLWVIQEIVLASSASVFRSKHHVDCDMLHKVVRMLWHCEFLSRVQDHVILLQIIQIAERRILGTSPNLYFRISQFVESEASDPRDKILGLLGMYKPISQAEDVCADYPKSTAELFQEIVELIAVELQDLSIWRFITLELSVRQFKRPAILGTLFHHISYLI